MVKSLFTNCAIGGLNPVAVVRILAIVIVQSKVFHEVQAVSE